MSSERPYNVYSPLYNDGMTAADHVMTISRNGQVSIPAATRARWGSRRVLVVDLGDHVAIRPLPEDDPILALEGKYAGRGPDTDAMRRQDREEEADIERRRHGRAGRR